ncbi:MAG: apolipoprotein N-acyltransferase [Bacteroidota bacterium]|nr:apolipoprotein N-acyltransferase [Bacteroidota bacterium]
MNRAIYPRTFITLSALTVLLLSLPFLVPGCGVMVLSGLVPLLAMERIASREGIRRFWLWHYGIFLLWNVVTTWWVCNATLGGGIFAATANALQMSLVFGLFRAVKKKLGDRAISYFFLAALWIAWERFYLVSAEISWPWLVLGNAFAGDIGLIQWYEYTGVLGGSLWIWGVNLSLFGIMVSVAEGRWRQMPPKARYAALGGGLLLLFGPMIVSAVRWNTYEETKDPLPVLVVQPNIDPYEKFKATLQDGYDVALCEAVEEALDSMDQPWNDGSVMSSEVETSALLVVAPETFTWGMDLGRVAEHPTQGMLVELAARHPELAMNVLYGASTYDRHVEKPSRLAERRGGAWVEQHNTALMTDASGRIEYYNKSKLVVGVEATPYPAIFVPVDDWLGGVMGRNVGQDRRTPLFVVTRDDRRIPVGCAICYESVYGEFCTEYVRDAGAELLAVITNDGWWGDSPGYRQHLRYSSLRAIETRRDIVRCGNTGISALIDQRGRILAETPWWQSAVLAGEVNLNSYETFFVRNGDIVGRISVLVTLLLLALFLVRCILPKE